jgi:aconitate hydratase
VPLQFLPGESAETLGLAGEETFTIRGIAGLGVGDSVEVEVNGGERTFRALARLDADADVTIFRSGGLLQMMMRRMAS